MLNRETYTHGESKPPKPAPKFKILGGTPFKVIKKMMKKAVKSNVDFSIVAKNYGLIYGFQFLPEDLEFTTKINPKNIEESFMFDTLTSTFIENNTTLLLSIEHLSTKESEVIHGIVSVITESSSEEESNNTNNTKEQ